MILGEKLLRSRLFSFVFAGGAEADAQTGYGHPVVAGESAGSECRGSGGHHGYHHLAAAAQTGRHPCTAGVCVCLCVSVCMCVRVRTVP